MRPLLYTLAALYALSMLALWGAEQVFLRASPRGGSVRGAGRDVWLHSEDGARIYAYYVERDPASPTLLYLHGAAGTVASRADRLALFASLGASLLAVEYRGYGPNHGRPSERALELDALAAYDWLRERDASARIVPFGESFGGGLACWLATQRRVAGLILLSTATSLPDLAAHFLPWLPTRAIMGLQLDTLTRIADVRAPKLFIHSRADRVVPFAMANALFERAPAPKHSLWLEGAGHDDTFYRAREQAAAALRQFLASLARED